MLDFAPCILLVDDDRVVADAMSLVLEAHGFACRTAENSIEALKALLLISPDVLISDLRMPRMSGVELLPIVRSRYPEIAIIVISSESVENVQSIGLPMDAFLQKGAFVSKHLIATIRQVSGDAHFVCKRSSYAKDEDSSESSV